MMEMVDVKNVTKIVPSITRKRILIVFFIPLSCLIQNVLLLFLTAPRYILLIPHSSPPSNNVQFVYFSVFKFHFDAYHLNKLTQNHTHAHYLLSFEAFEVSSQCWRYRCLLFLIAFNIVLCHKESFITQDRNEIWGGNRWGHCPRDHNNFTWVQIFWDLVTKRNIWISSF